jgi:chorismate mutase
MPRKPQENASYFTLRDPKRRAKVDALLLRLNAERDAHPIGLASWLRDAIDSSLRQAEKEIDAAMIDEELLHAIDAHIEKLNAKTPDDPYDRKRFIRVSVRKAMRAEVGHTIGQIKKQA